MLPLVRRRVRQRRRASSALYHSGALESVRIISVSADDNDKKKLDPERLAGEVGEDEEKIPYPKSVFFILSTEACERFSYYGMRGEGH